MKLQNVKGICSLSKNEQQTIVGGGFIGWIATAIDNFIEPLTGERPLIALEDK